MRKGDVWLTSRRELNLSGRVLIMGVLNVTPDSFSDGGSFLDPGRAVERALAMADEGADIIDIGAESTRPGASRVPEEEEISRLLPVLEGLVPGFPLPVSVDTYKARVAELALTSGAEIINDVSGLKGDPGMAGVVSRHKAGLVIMHMRGDPGTMRSMNNYSDVTVDVRRELEESAGIALEAGVEPERMVFDPGIGFAKDHIQSCTLMNRLDRLSVMDRPIMIGISRKSYIGRILGLPVEERLEGTIAAGILSIVRGARILRVHDVKEVRRAVDVAMSILQECVDQV